MIMINVYDAGKLLKRLGLLWAVSPMEKKNNESLVWSLCWKQIEQVGTWGNGLRL
jgi:hypothetical protein